MGNARSLNNKLDELRGNCRYMHEYREASMICLSETWFDEKAADNILDLNSFFLFRLDRDTSQGKDQGGGVCAYINSRWCHKNNIKIIHKSCSPDLEILSLKIRPFYLPREFPSIVVNIVYIPPDANHNIASDIMSEKVNEQLSKSPDSAIYITGDFNHCTLEFKLPNFYQYVNVNTRNDNILDLFYCNVKNSYVCSALAPLGKSDHNMVLLRPKYLPVLKTKKTERKTVRVLNGEGEERLRDCFDCTNWNVFTEACSDVNELCETVSEYIHFCEQMVTVNKDVIIYPNSKPWFTKNIKQLIQNKQTAFKDRDTISLNRINTDIKKEIWKAKKKYKQKLEDCFKANNAREAWSGLKLITGYKNTNCNSIPKVDQKYVNDLNSFFARFEDSDSKKEVPVLESCDECVVVEEYEVRREFERVNARKACGPDRVKGRILKLCSAQLCYIFTVIINMSLQSHIVPSLWKCSELIPIPKRNITQFNDFRPVALTSIAMKCMEKLILKRLRPFFDPIQDPFQFAYRRSRSVEDAIILFLDNVYRHLDKPRSYCRILFVDFSSAFNTIKPVILIERLRAMGINPNIISWIFNFLTHRTQYVKLQDTFSTYITTHTGSPQGCVLSPVLFTMYTNECQINTENVKLIKFADDSSVQGLLNDKNDESLYTNSIEFFTNWCDENKLLLNTDKTKELIIDFRKKKDPVTPLVIKNKEIEQVSSYKYLGITIDNKLNWQLQATNVTKKINKRMFFLRKLKIFQIDRTILSLFYSSTIQSLITFCIIGWGGNTRSGEVTKVNNVIRRAGKIAKSSFNSFAILHDKLCLKKIKEIESDKAHPLSTQLKRSQRSNRPIHILCKTQRYKQSFTPYAITLLSQTREQL